MSPCVKIFFDSGVLLLVITFLDTQATFPYSHGREKSSFFAVYGKVRPANRWQLTKED